LLGTCVPAAFAGTNITGKNFEESLFGEGNTMSKKVARYLFALGLCVSSFAVLAQSQTTSSTTNLLVSITQIKFSLAPGATKTFTLPKVTSPIRIEISAPSSNAGVQTPSELMWALVNWDFGTEGSNQITWIGTNSDGTTAGSNSLQSGTIANIYGGSSPTTISSLQVSDAATGTLKVTRSSATTTIDGNYIVKIYY
jgi:hypothetical protein